MTALPAPGLQGNYRESCLICLTGTDTGLAFVGEAEWAIAGLNVLGVPMDQAPAVFDAMTGCVPGTVPDGEMTVVVTVCASCVQRSSASFEVGLLACGTIPHYRPRT